MLVNEFIELLDEVELAHTEIIGGYPAIWYQVGEFLVRAGVIDGGNEPELDVFTQSEVDSWIENYQLTKQEEPEWDLEDLIYETKPSQSFHKQESVNE